MTIEAPDFAEFESFRKITDPKERSKIKECIEDPHILTGMDRLRAFYEKMSLEFDEESFEKIISDCLSQI